MFQPLRQTLRTQTSRQLSVRTITRTSPFSQSTRLSSRADNIQSTVTTRPARPPPGSVPLKVKHGGKRSASLSRQPTPPPTKTAEECMALYPYLVRRTASAQLPVYRKWMSGGTRQIIQVKKIDGDRRRFMQDLAEAIRAGKDEIRLNPTTLQVEVKGNYMDRTSTWLLSRGF